MSTEFLLDTDTCIDLMRGNPSVVHRAKSYSPSQLSVSTITQYELEVGVRKCARPNQERKKVNMLLKSIGVVVFDRQAAIAAGEIRAGLEESGNRIGPYDILLAATAVSRAFTLVSANHREFSRIDALRLVSWRV